jgi:type IV secretion system protein VirB4
MKTASQKLAKLDPRAGDRLPYAGHVNNCTIASRSAELIQMIQLDGIAFETADSETLNHMAAVRDVVMRGIANSNLMLYCHVIRRRVAAELSGSQPEGFARDLDMQWQAHLRAKRLYINDMVLMLVRRPATGKVGFVERMTKWTGSRSKANVHAEQARELRELDGARINLMR